MRTVVAFGGGVRVGINIECVVGTGLHASLAADTAAIVEIDDPVTAAEQSRDRANFHAGSIVAMIATHHGEQATRLRELPFFDIFDPRSIYTDGNFVLAFAGDRAGMTADTAAVINDESVVCHNWVFRITEQRREAGNQKG